MGFRAQAADIAKGKAHWEEQLKKLYEQKEDIKSNIARECFDKPTRTNPDNDVEGFCETQWLCVVTAMRKYIYENFPAEHTQ